MTTSSPLRLRRPPASSMGKGLPTAGAPPGRTRSLPLPGTPPRSDGVRVRLRKLALRPAGHPLEWLHRPGFVDVDDGVDLVRQPGPEVVARALRVRAVDDADGPLRAGGAERLGRLWGRSERPQELLLADLVEPLLAAPRQGRPYLLALGRPSPVVRRRHRARVGGEAEEERVPGMPLPNELADVELAVARHLRRPGVAEVRVVRPHDDPGLPAAPAAEVACQRVEGVRHVLVPQVPGRHPTPEHRAVVLLRRLDRPGILLGVEELVLGQQPVTAGGLPGGAPGIDEVLAR